MFIQTCSSADTLAEASISIVDINSVCGAVWNNPGFITILPKVFDEMDQWVTRPHALWWFLYALPFLLKKKELVAAEELPVAGKWRNLTKSIQSEHRVKPIVYRVTPPEDEGFEMFEFVRGKYGFRHRVDFPLATWYGISILHYSCADFCLEGPEGKYWLWYEGLEDYGEDDGEICRCIVVDSYKRKAFIPDYVVFEEERDWIALSNLTPRSKK